MEGLIQFIQANWKDFALIGTSIVTIASIIVKFTPTKKDDEILAKILKIFEVLSFNKKA